MGSPGLVRVWDLLCEVGHVGLYFQSSVSLTCEMVIMVAQRLSSRIYLERLAGGARGMV